MSESSNTSTVRLTSKIVSVSLSTAVPAPVVIAESVVTTTTVVQGITEKMRRPEILEGRTYKIKTPLSDSALYLTMNDAVLNQGTPFETRQPFEIFINSKEMQNYQWIVAFTRLISAIFRKGGDVTFIIEELKSVFDPNGGYFTSKGRIPSLVAEIGMTIEEHFKHIGLIVVEVNEVLVEKKAEYVAQGGAMANAEICAKCNDRAVIILDGCKTCVSCGDSRCG